VGRQQEFDTGAVVRRARAVFWEHGYDGASVPALERATGVGRSSLYHAFGSKRGLFDAAVTSYLDEVVRPRLRPLRQTDVDPTALAGYLAGLREALAAAPRTPGCLLLNTATSPLGGDAAVAATVGAYRAELASALAAGVRAARPELDAAAARHLTATLTGLVLAAFALARTDPAAATSCLDTALVAAASPPHAPRGTRSASR